MAPADASGCAQAVRAALEGGALEQLVAARRRVEALPPSEQLQLVVAERWGELLAAGGPLDAGRLGLLAALSEPRPPPALRGDFYASFEAAGLCEACCEAVSRCTGRPEGVDARLCVRNLARGPPLRARLASSVQVLVPSLDAGLEAGRAELLAAGAAALCNVCCDATLKAEAVRLGGVERALRALKAQPTHKAAEELVACVGVLVAGFTPGLSQLFQCGEAPVLLSCLYCDEHPPLQVLAAEVVSDAASASTMFTSWLVTDTDLVDRHLGKLLDTSADPQVLDSSLRLCQRLMTVDAFGQKVSAGAALTALQALAQSTDGRKLIGLDDLSVDGDGRRGVTRKEVAMSILSTVLHF